MKYVLPNMVKYHLSFLARNIARVIGQKCDVGSRDPLEVYALVYDYLQGNIADLPDPLWIGWIQKVLYCAGDDQVLALDDIE